MASYNEHERGYASICSSKTRKRSHERNGHPSCLLSHWPFMMDGVPISRYEKCQHVLCNAHLLRELQGIYEQTKEEWAQEMMELLLSAKAKKDQNNGKVDVSALIKMEREYERILQKAIRFIRLRRIQIHRAVVLNNIRLKTYWTALAVIAMPSWLF